MRSNLEDREDVIRDLGADEFYSNDAFKGLWDIYPPECFAYVYRAFIELYNGCSEKITWVDIDSYCRVRKEDFTQREIELIRKMSVWADEEIAELKKDED